MLRSWYLHLPPFRSTRHRNHGEKYRFPLSTPGTSSRSTSEYVLITRANVSRPVTPSFSLERIGSQVAEWQRNNIVNDIIWQAPSGALKRATLCRRNHCYGKCPPRNDTSRNLNDIVQSRQSLHSTIYVYVYVCYAWPLCVWVCVSLSSSLRPLSRERRGYTPTRFDHQASFRRWKSRYMAPFISQSSRHSHLDELRCAWSMWFYFYDESIRPGKVRNLTFGTNPRIHFREVVTVADCTSW